MTETEKLVLLKDLIDEHGATNDSKLEAYLNIAKNRILNKAYPFKNRPDSVPAEYEVLQCELASYLWFKQGAEGQTSHSENGITRNYGSDYIPESMLRDVTPYCGTF